MMPPPQLLIRVENVAKEYHLESSRIDVLRGVSAEIRSG